MVLVMLSISKNSFAALIRVVQHHSWARTFNHMYAKQCRC